MIADKKEEEIIKIINSIAGKYPANKVFADWITMYALSITNNACPNIGTSVWHKREKEYNALRARYKTSEFEKLTEMCVLLNDALQSQIYDVLGSIYMREGYGEKRVKQYYTPFEISELSANIVLESKDKEIIKVHEPTCGSGSMVIAIAKKLGNAYQSKLEVIAQDLDWNNVYMSYIQFTLLNIKATVVQGDVLEGPFSNKTKAEKIFKTPAMYLPTYFRKDDLDDGRTI